MPATYTKEDIPRFVKPGMRLNATFEFGPQDSLTLPAFFVGLKHAQYLIIEVVDKEDFVLRKLENADVILRGIADTELGHVVAFKTSVLSVITKPDFLLFLRFPTALATKPIREHERYKIDLQGTLNHDGNLYEGRMSDFSLSGCGFITLAQPEFHKGEIVKVETPLNRFLSADNPAKVASIRKLANGWSVGIKYEKPVLLSKELKRELLELSFHAGLV
ncbi:flagellar brake protein [Vibrio sp. IRLE0018]|uniref:PilZ domain-containing protein n=1 Tax=Vibrio TaxID=662 RepID=UPI0015941366|nr:MULTISPECIES: PilZ domain-containing protein [Vibrio]MCF8777564.1 flagellar brake protein [Vibrio floridensis]NVC61549.1 flagellar brake protein [Vibrio sp. 05-20-BW147]HAS6346704.1 flagellar brake protein [Vibrio vulnificus]